MPKTTFERVIFTCTGVLLMATTMALYNKYLVYGEFSAEVFRQTLIAFFQKAPLAFLAQFFFVQKLAGKLSAKYTTDNQMVYYCIRTGFTVLIMCPLMSLYSNLILMIQLDWTFWEMIANWIPKMTVNWVFAFFVQIFLLGPANHFIFRSVFNRKLHGEASPAGR